MPAEINMPCERCDGTGKIVRESLEDCPTCDGKGWIKEVIDATA